MVAVVGSVAATPRVIDPSTRVTIERLARWLLVAVGLDLVVTRFLVRLAIFVPKGDPFATASAALGRVAAAADALVPIVGILLLGFLLVWAGRAGSLTTRAMLIAVTVVGTGGFALVVYPPTPVVVVVLSLLIGSVALVSAARVGLDRGLAMPARLGLASLGLAVGAAATARALDASGIVGSAAWWPDWIGGLTFGVIGEVGFVVGAALVGLAGLRTPRTRSRRRAIIGLLAGLAVLVAGSVAPVSWATLTIWSVGLTGSVPVPLVAIAVGLAVGGLPAHHERRPSAAVGAAIVLLAGYGLAASGLVLASLLGLIIAGLRGVDRTASASSGVVDAWQ